MKDLSNVCLTKGCSEKKQCIDDEGPEDCTDRVFPDIPCIHAECEEVVQGLCSDPECGVTCDDREES